MQKSVNSLKLFLQEEYAFRRNLLSGKIEYRELHAEADAEVWKCFTAEDLNSLVMAAEEALPDQKSMEKKLRTIVYSRLTPDYDPIAEWLNGLPAWDGKNHVGALFDRLPGLHAEQRYWLTVWLRSVVAHWLQMDALHGNDVVPVFIGSQGCGKSTFCRLLLPEHLREYFLDHVNLKNKFDKEMALTSNLLVNIDELDQVRRMQQAELKHLISKVRVNGRQIYGRDQADRRRYASFVATTNNRHPLHDPTGSRRFLCIEIAEGRLIDNDTPIDYEQLFAQVMSELRNGQRYWFTDEETRSLQAANTPYQSTLDMELMIEACFRKPAADEPCQPIPMTEIVSIVAQQYPFIQPTRSTKIQLGIALSACGFEMTRDAQLRRYYVIPRTAA